ncbi:MAG: hypothetical protein POG74_11985 [Acidocella sp.]|nr:hypothetical protein [Acidocella sp.]
MQGFIKTLFGDTSTLAVTAGAIFAAVLVLHSPVPALAGAVLPLGLLAGAAYLARR